MKRSGLSDTSPEAERVLADSYRAMSPARKWSLMSDAFRFARSWHEAGLRWSHPGATRAEIHRSWLGEMLGEGPWLACEGGTTVDQPKEYLAVVREVVEAFDRLGIAYALGGSMASSFYGSSRQTRDADISVEPFPGREGELASCFGPDYYLSAEAIRQAIRDRSSFNIINTSAGFKVDVFIRKDRPFERSLMQRRTTFQPDDPAEGPIRLVSAEDIVLLKLEWYRLGGETSERQWRDVIGVLRTQAGRLDEAYLDHWAADLKVEDLLAEARAEVSA